MTKALHIFRKEFKGYFVSPIAYIVISIFLILSGWFFFSTFFLFGQAEMRSFFSLLPIIFSFIVPAITMRLFSEEFNTGSYELLFTMPVTSLDIIIGKFLAAVAFVVIMLVPTFTYGIFISMLGDLDWGPVLAGYTGAILLGAAFSGIGIFASSLTRNQIVAFITGMTFCVILTLLDKMLFFVPHALLNIFQYLAADYHFQNISRGIIDSRDLLYFLSTCFVMLYGTNLVIRGGGIVGAGKRSNRYYTFLMYLVVVILLNVAGMTLFFRADLTSNNVYSLSEASKRVVNNLSEPLTVKVFFSRNLPAPYNNTERYLRDLLEEYAISGKRRFNYQFHNVSAEDDSESGRNQELARNYGVQPVQIQNIEQDEVKFQQAYMGMALLHGDVIESIPSITSTDGLEYQITSTIQKMSNKVSALLKLKEPVSVNLYLSSSLVLVGPYMNITGLAQLPDRIKEKVGSLNRKNYGKLAFIHYDPGADQEAEREAEKRRVLRLNWQEFRDRQGEVIPAGRGYAGIIVKHGERTEIIRLIEIVRLPLFGTQYQLIGLDDLEEAIDKSVEAVIDINEEIGYVADHGTPPIGQELPMMGGGQESPITSLNRLLSETYSVRQVNLKDGGIPDGLSFLMIAGPTEDFSEYELYQIDQFLMKGKSLAVFLDSFSEVRPPGQDGMFGQAQQSFHVPLSTGLEKLLSHYGLEVHHSIVLDENSYRQRVPAAFGGGERKIYFAPIIKNEMINREAGYLNNIKGLVMLKASPVTVHEERIKANDLKATRLFSSSGKSWEMKERIELNPMFLMPPGEEDAFRSISLAYSVEGRFPSYFADRPLPVKEEKAEGEEGDGGGGTSGKGTGLDMSEIAPGETTIKRGEPGKILLIGTSEILKDNVIDAEGQTPNAQFIMNAIDYLNGRGETAVLRSKVQKFNPLREVAPAVRTTIKSANIAGLPVLVVVAGFIVWARRAARKRMIQKIFSG